MLGVDINFLVFTSLLNFKWEKSGNKYKPVDKPIYMIYLQSFISHL